MNLNDIINQITPEIYESLKEAVALGKWGDGNPLTQDQKEICLQAIIVYEQRLPEEERLGHIQSAECASHDDRDPNKPDEQIITIQ